MTSSGTATPSDDFAAPGSLLVIRDETWLVVLWEGEGSSFLGPNSSAQPS